MVAKHVFKHFDIFFVHGINTTVDEIHVLRERVLGLISKAASVHKNKWTFTLHMTYWPSKGDFFQDLVLLGTNYARRAEAVSAVLEQIKPKLGKNNIIIGHSMGQLIGACATQGLSSRIDLFVGLGGPLGNTSLSVSKYVDTFVGHYSPLSKISRFADVWNGQDPICANFLSHIWALPKLSMMFKHVLSSMNVPYDPKRIENRLYVKDVHSFKLDYPGTPTPNDPLIEHSAYFKSDDVSVFIATEILTCCEGHS